jgi:hypothetical protein
MSYIMSGYYSRMGWRDIPFQTWMAGLPVRESTNFIIGENSTQTLMEDYRIIIWSCCGTIRALMPNGDSVDHFRVAADFSCRSSCVHIERISKPTPMSMIREASLEGLDTHRSRPSPTAMILLLSPSQDRSFLWYTLASATRNETILTSFPKWLYTLPSESGLHQQCPISSLRPTVRHCTVW